MVDLEMLSKISFGSAQQVLFDTLSGVNVTFLLSRKKLLDVYEEDVLITRFLSAISILKIHYVLKLVETKSKPLIDTNRRTITH